MEKLAYTEDKSIYSKLNKRSVANSATLKIADAKFNYESLYSKDTLAPLNLTNMKAKTINQEILLFAGTNFFSRPYCIKEPDNNTAPLYSRMENLEKACWAGILSEILPELISRSLVDHKSYLWQTLPSRQFLRVSMGTQPQRFESETSIDPYFFLPAMNNN